MTAAPPPDDDTLRAFLLGTLPAEAVERVRAWLDADPHAADRLRRLNPADPLTGALASPPPPPIPDDTVARIGGGVQAGLSTPAPDDETPAEGTVRQDRPPAPTDGPARLGQFRIVRELGHGGMGYVYEAEDETLHRRVAVKTLHPDLAARPGAAARFLREARAAAKVEHENVVPILHVGDDAGTPFIVMPLLRGEPLDKRLKREGALPPDEVRRVGRQIAAGLGAAHGCGLVHRDMKPANVWLDAGTGRARVLDFGLARHGDGRDALTEGRVLQGTPAYMPPEVLDGGPGDARGDLFALGAILYECATGARAFPGATVTAILKAVATRDPDPPAALNPAVPAVLSDLIVRLLSKDPAGRPASAAEVGAGLADGEATVTWVDRATPPRPRGRRAALAAVGAAVLLAAGVGAWLGTRPKPPETVQNPPAPAPAPEAGTKPEEPPKPVTYKGGVEVKIERDEPTGPRLYRLNEAGALPLRPNDKFAIEAQIDPPAFVYLLWIDPGADVTGVYPWKATADDWKGTRPAAESKVGRVRLPETAGNFYRAWDGQPGIATVLMLACETPLDVPDGELEGMLKGLPSVALSNRSETAVVWHRNYGEVTTNPLLVRGGFTEVGGSDPFARWQGALQKKLSDRRIVFQASASFARTGTAK